ncbi:MAG TPA: DinB family protein, partial [Rhodothermia bacterium]|nr:DinB family protein [Rhodothermia bacterium]
MISISPWFERVFHFGLEPEYFPLVLERLIGTRPRLDALLAGASTVSLLDRPGGAWSVQQHVGHLGDLEPLWYGRVDDILSGLPEMRPADLLNRATDAADHNDRPIGEVLESFSALRDRFTGRLAG